MGKIKRYNPDWDYDYYQGEKVCFAYMNSVDHGDYVSYGDHERVVAEMQDYLDFKDNLIDELEKQIVNLLNKYT